MRISPQEANMKLRYEAQIIDEDTDEVLAKVDSYSLEGLEEEMGKTKFKVEYEEIT